MDEPTRLYLYLLRDPNSNQAAWIRASTIESASNALYAKTDVPVVVVSNYGWNLLGPEGYRRVDEEECPLPYWEFAACVRGIADLKVLPDYMRSLGQSCAPRRKGQVKLGDAFPRAKRDGIRRITPTTVVDRVQVGHPGWSAPYWIHAVELAGFDEQNLHPISIGATAILEFEEPQGNAHGLEKLEEADAKVGDMVRVRLAGDTADRFVVGQVVKRGVFIKVIDIEEA